MDLNTLFLAFVPLFVAVDALGMTPILAGMTQGMEASKRNKLITTSALVALLVAVLFVLGGEYVFRIVGITEHDFRVAGGVLLLALSIYDILFSQQGREDNAVVAGVVPIGIPLTIGPAALATLLMLVKSYGYLVTFVSLYVNVFIAWICYRHSHWIVRILGQWGSKAFSKVMGLFMAGFAVMMIRIGIMGIVESFQ